MQTGMEMSAAVAVGFIAGYYADGKLGTSPWLALIGSALGIASSLRIAFQAVSRAGEKQTKNDK
ncbi:MAG: AtpZ/AtpI family protein [Elusimicrobia bacterium]|nr:AtpZ/AtpI family protein [Elusimicrobiota bacterium]